MGYRNEMGAQGLLMRDWATYPAASRSCRVSDVRRSGPSIPRTPSHMRCARSFTSNACRHGSDSVGPTRQRATTLGGAHERISVKRVTAEEGKR